MENPANLAIKAALTNERTFYKFLSANDSGETGGHQCGILVSKKAASILFDTPLMEKIDRWASIQWQNGLITKSHFIYYKSKHELRITNFGRSFPLIKPSNTGSLFILSQIDYQNYLGFVIDSEDQINNVLDALDISQVNANSLIGASSDEEVNGFLQQWKKKGEDQFPTSNDLSDIARATDSTPEKRKEDAIQNPDTELLRWIEIEYRFFQAVENQKFGPKVAGGFKDMKDFRDFAKSVLNRRKSRAGKSLEHHLAEIFKENGLLFTAQPTSEEKKTPDFLFPSEAAYHDPSFPEEKLIFLAAKTTCKDRWRQILNEAQRTKTKFLCTLQQGITATQMDEMKEAEVVLVVPKPYIAFYPPECRDDIWTLKEFIDYVKLVEGE
jgi:hypothetical protein